METRLRTTMAMPSDKQDFEINAVRLFQTASKVLCGYELVPGDDPPDVVACHGDHRVGIEVRRLFADEGKGGSPQRRHLSLCGKVVDCAQTLHREVTDRWYIVRVFFSRSQVIHEKRVEEIAKALLYHACSEVLMDNESRDFRSEDYWGRGWPEEVDLMTVAVLPGEGPPEWGISAGAWVGSTSRELIQSSLDSKEAPCRLFPAGIRDRWLLLVCDESVESSLLRLHEDMETESYRSSYNRAFVLDSSGKKCAELRIARK